ncbi:hypothetical protein MBLNU457_7075t1 [Dothideomycetes sp. NU457]
MPDTVRYVEIDCNSKAFWHNRYLGPMPYTKEEMEVIPTIEIYLNAPDQISFKTLVSLAIFFTKNEVIRPSLRKDYASNDCYYIKSTFFHPGGWVSSLPDIKLKWSDRDAGGYAFTAQQDRAIKETMKTMMTLGFRHVMRNPGGVCCGVLAREVFDALFDDRHDLAWPTGRN